MLARNLDNHIVLENDTSEHVVMNEAGLDNQFVSFVCGSNHDVVFLDWFDVDIYHFRFVRIEFSSIKILYSGNKENLLGPQWLSVLNLISNDKTDRMQFRCVEADLIGFDVTKYLKSDEVTMKRLERSESL